jgi:DNA ligase-associated metallophosphoesterase
MFAQDRSTLSDLDGEALAGSGPVRVGNTSLVLDAQGALYWPEEGLLAVADLHLEKGSSFAARGVLIPPYDTEETLTRLALLIARYDPRLVVALGDSFHDGGGPVRIAVSDRDRLAALQRGRDWLWIAGNHDPEPIQGLGGSSAALVLIGGLCFRHEPSRGTCTGEISGHLHPVARIAVRGRGISRRCFASDGQRMVMPAFGAYTGGLNVRSRAFSGVFATGLFTVHLLGEARLYPVPASRCLAN